MNHIVSKENRPFSYLDFVNFTVDGNNYSVSKGTFRNKICYIFKDEVEVACYSPIAFYTLKGHTFSNSVTITHTRGVNNINKKNITSIIPDNSDNYFCNIPIYRYIKNLPFGKRSVHDIRLRFTVKGLWSLLSNSFKFESLTSSNDILITKFERENLNVRVTIHDTDTVSISVGCTFAPVDLDINGLMRLSTVLAITEDRISREIEEILKATQQVTASLSVPYYGSWLITMWHFGRDAEITFSKKEFNIEFRTAEEIIYRIYDKYWKYEGKRRIRIEKQEYPQKSFAEAIEEQLNK